MGHAVPDNALAAALSDSAMSGDGWHRGGRPSGRLGRGLLTPGGIAGGEQTTADRRSAAKLRQIPGLGGRGQGRRDDGGG